MPRSRQTVAIIYPKHGSGLWDCPDSSTQGLTGQAEADSLNQCSARAAQNIWEHHRPAVGSRMQHLEVGHSTSEKQPWLSGSPPGPAEPGRTMDTGAGPDGPKPYMSTSQGRSGRQRSHSLSGSARQITPPIRSGHAPPSRQSRKS
jgi:hypothetical protein